MSSHCHPKWRMMMGGQTFLRHFVTSIPKFFGEPQSWWVLVWIVLPLLSVEVRADLRSSGPWSLYVSLSFCLCAHYSPICLHKMCSPVRIVIAHSIQRALQPPPPPSSKGLHSPGTTGQLKETQENVSLSTFAVFHSHFLHDCSALFVYVKMTQ